MDAQWLKAQFKIYPSKTKAELARALGLEPPAVSKILAGTRQIKACEYMKMREFFGLGLIASGSAGQSKSAYVIETLGHTLSDQDNFAGEWAIPASIISQKTRATPEQIKIFQIHETVMEPEFRKGEHVVVDLSDKKPSPPGVFVISDGFGFLVRSCAFVPSSSPPQIKISAAQKDFEPHIFGEEEIEITGRVIAKMQWI